MASNPLSITTPIPTTDKLKQALQTVTDAALFIEQLLSATGVEGTSGSVIEQATQAFGNLAAIAIQAAHDVAGKQITPDSVLQLLPVATPLVSPADAATA